MSENMHLGELTYCSTRLYQFDITPKARYAVGTSGGPLAIYIESHSIPSYFLLYSGMQLTATIYPQLMDEIISFGWTSTEKLVLVTVSGKVHMYTIMGESLYTFSITDLIPISSLVIINTVFCTNTILLHSSCGRLIAIDAISENDLLNAPTTVAYLISRPDDCLDCKVNDMVQLDIEGMMKVGISFDNGTLIITDKYYPKCIDLHILSIAGVIMIMTVSPNLIFVAMYTSDGMLIVCSSDFGKKVCILVPHHRPRPLKVLC
jgi:hypothetical protein